MAASSSDSELDRLRRKLLREKKTLEVEENVEDINDLKISIQACETRIQELLQEAAALPIGSTFTDLINFGDAVQKHTTTTQNKSVSFRDC